MAEAIKYIMHALNLIFQNIGVAMRITVGWVALILAMIVGFVFLAANGTNEPNIGTLFGGVAIFFVALFAFASCAVAWHRFILLDEQPSGFIALPPKGLGAAYTIRLVGITLIAFLIILIPAIILSLFFSASMEDLSNPQQKIGPLLFISFVLSVAVQYIITRLSLSLPAVALGNAESFKIADGWRFGGQKSGLIFLIILISTGVATLFALALQTFLDPSQPASVPIFVTALQVVFNWFYFMFGIGILTTLYGSIVEGREI